MFKDSCSFSLRVAFEAKQRGVARSSSSSPQTSTVCKGDTSQPWVTTVVWMCQWQLHGEEKEEKSRKKKANETEAICKANRGGKAALQLTYTEGASKKRSIIHNLKSNTVKTLLCIGAIVTWRHSCEAGRISTPMVEKSFRTPLKCINLNYYHQIFARDFFFLGCIRGSQTNLNYCVVFCWWDKIRKTHLCRSRTLDVILLKHSVLCWTGQCMCSTWINEGDWTGVKCTYRLKTDSSWNTVHHKCITNAWGVPKDFSTTVES